MDAVFTFIEEINSVINEFIWVKIGLVALLGTGLYLTVISGFFQVRHIGLWFKTTLGQILKRDSAAKNTKNAHRAISEFQSLCTALAATIGTGNIAGVSTAIVMGGPGAIFWMWVAAFFGMMTKFAEEVLGLYYRRKNSDGEWSGGAMYYLKDGLGKMKHGKKIGPCWQVLVLAICHKSIRQSSILKKSSLEG